MVLVVGVQAVWRSARAARRRASELAVYAAAQAEEMAILAEHLNRNGFELRNTSQSLFPKIRQWQAVLGSPIVLAAMPWALRRLFGRPLRRR
ncbi:MAG: hypothetical protein E6J01_11375 [Chloroflexi bacterium]|nr:MAG: hypothetical protein E6J01_11375 [Chloroflexota bacterium]